MTTIETVVQKVLKESHNESLKDRLVRGQIGVVREGILQLMEFENYTFEGKDEVDDVVNMLKDRLVYK